MTQVMYAACVSTYFLVFSLYTQNRLGLIVNKVTLFLGRISYSLYLIHYAIAYKILIPMFQNSKRFEYNIWVVNFLIVLPIVLILATLINRFVEVPAMKYIKSRALTKS